MDESGHLANDTLMSMIFRSIVLLFAFFLCLPMEAQSLKDVNVETFKQAFNASSGTVRLVALLSPT